MIRSVISIHYLYSTQLNAVEPNYSKEHFDWNQLLNCSMGLSPLYSILTSDLHVNIVQDLPLDFRQASIISSIDRDISGFSVQT